MKVIKPPTNVVWEQKPVIFLAGSIEMGTAINWQDQVANYLSDWDITLLNPRRDDWDTSWHQTISNAQFKQQVDWELDGLDLADIIIMHFDPSTKSPITLMELGLYASSGKLIVHCPEPFWRKGNVDVVCHRYAIPQAVSIEDLCDRAIVSLSL